MFGPLANKGDLIVNTNNNNNNSNFFYLQVANSPSKPGFKANLSERIIREQIAV